MLESKLCNNKTEAKNVKVAKTVEFIKTCDQCPRKAKADSNRYFLQQNLSTCSRDVKSYQTYIRPIVEYTSTVWDPNSKDLQCKVESVQRKAACWITNYWRRFSIPTKMLEDLGLYTLFTLSAWNKLPPRIVYTISMEQFSDYVSDLHLQHFA